MFHPQRAVISRDGNHGPLLNEVSGMVATEPHVGDPLQLFLDNGRIMRTTTVKNIRRDGDNLVVDTENSRYRLVLRAA